MHKKRALVLWAYLSLLALAACGPKVIDDSDLVSIDYKYSLVDWTVLEEWSDQFIVWDESDYQWLESIVRWAKQDNEFEGRVNWWEIYGYAYDESLVQSYSNLIMTEVFWVFNPKIWDKVHVESFRDWGEISWDWFITSQGQDEEWYAYYVVDFNNPKTYSDLSYSVKITGIEKR